MSKSFCKLIKDKLSCLDIFGQRIDLTYNKEIYYRTYYGAIYTIFMVIFLLMQAYEGYRYHTSLNPIINFMEMESDKHFEIDIGKSNITIAISFAAGNKNESLYDANYFDLDIRSILRSKNETNDKSSLFPIDLKTCSKADFKQHEQLFDTFNLDKAVCIQPPVDKSIIIFNSVNEYIENYIKITIKFCRDKVTCKSDNEIIERLLDLNLYVYIKHDYFDGLDFNQGIKSRLSFQKWTFDDHLIKKKDSLYLTMNSLKDYNTLLINLWEPQPKAFISFSQKDIVRNFKIGKSDKLIEVYLRANPNPIYIQRKYYTLIDLLASVGGLFNVFFILGMIIFGYINKVLFDCRIINDHFNIVDNIPKAKDDSYFRQTIPRNSFQLENLRKDYNVERFSNNTSDSEHSRNRPPFRTLESDEILKEKLIFHRHRYFKFRYVFADVLKSFCCWKSKQLSKKNKVYNHCKKIIDNYTDIKNLISTIQEFKVVRHVLFNKIQLDLINYYKKPIIQINDRDLTLIYRKSVLEEEDLDVCDFKDNLDILNFGKNSDLFKDKTIDEKLIELGNICK
jgi:hypothetical protein